MNSIHDICKRYGITNYTINDDGTIDVDGDVNLYGKGLTELPLIFNRVSGTFSCSFNKLTTLKGSPIWVGGNFGCSCNRLTSLEFSPDYVVGGFYCYSNPLIDNYCDTEIGDKFYATTIVVDNYNEWRKMYKRKKILEQIFDK